MFPALSGSHTHVVNRPGSLAHSQDERMTPLQGELVVQTEREREHV